jgi:hypothetical protein
MHREFTNAYKILIRKPEGKIQFWRPGLKCKDNIKTGLKEIGCEG